MDTLQKLKTLLEISGSDEDDKLNLLIDMAQNEVIAYCNLDSSDDITDSLADAVCMIAVQKYNRMGTEGLTSEGYSGASYGYTDDYPASIVSVLHRHRRLRMV